jgi:hypothetical protein
MKFTNQNIHIPALRTLAQGKVSLNFYRMNGFDELGPHQKQPVIN